MSHAGVLKMMRRRFFSSIFIKTLDLELTPGVIVIHKTES
jgi:hypothetical protein